MEPLSAPIIASFLSGKLARPARKALGNAYLSLIDNRGIRE
jgi:hypothetical protein